MTYHRENLKQKLIDEAYKAIKKDGVETISLRKLAKKAKVSQTAPYRHFQSKDHLIIEVCLKGLSNLRAKIDAVDAKNPKTKAINGGLAFIDFGLKNEKIYELILATISGEITKDPLRIALFESADYTFSNLKNRITALNKKKNIQSQLDGIKVHAFLTGLLQVIRITNKVNTSGGLETYQAVKTASLLNKNLKKVISDFIDSL